MEKEQEVLEKITALLAEHDSSPALTDEVLPTTGLQVLTEDTWLPATREVWRSWVGLRAVWGIPYHGPVYAMGTREDAVPWTGPRTCRCNTCQEHVSPVARPN